MLSSMDIDQPRLEAELLLAHVLGLRKEDLIVHPDRELTDLQEDHFHQCIERRCRKEPLAYIIGYREFWSLEFQVNSAVLIPRPETEGMIDQLLNYARGEAGENGVRILDVGTGSGILAIVAALELPKAQVTAVDNSNDALDVARDNAFRHRVKDRIDFIKMDFMREWRFPDEGSFDYILANPPYIPSKELEQLMPDVRDYEPRVALDGGLDGLRSYQSIVAHAFPCLKPGGHLIFEVGDNQAEMIKQLLEVHGGLDKIEIARDLSGRDRVVTARRALG